MEAETKSELAFRFCKTFELASRDPNGPSKSWKDLLYSLIEGVSTGSPSVGLEWTGVRDNSPLLFVLSVERKERLASMLFHISPCWMFVLRPSIGMLSLGTLRGRLLLAFGDATEQGWVALDTVEKYKQNMTQNIDVNANLLGESGKCGPQAGKDVKRNIWAPW